MAENNDIKIFKKINGGDKKSFEELFRKYYPSLCRFVFPFVKDISLSEEIVQEMFIKIWDKREKININTTVKSYLYKASRNTALNFIKQKKDNISLDNTKIQYKNSDKTDIIEYKELEKQISEAIDSLPEKCREIFCLSRHEEMTYKQIADYLEISIKTVENQMGIALRKLRSYLKSVSEHVIMLFLHSFGNKHKMSVLKTTDF